MITITNSEMSLFRNKDKDYITTYLCEYVANICDYQKALYFSYSYSKEVLLRDYEALNKSNVTIINDTSITLDDFEKFLIQMKPNYLFVDFFNMTEKGRYLYINGDRFKYVNDKVNYYEKKYDVKILIVVNYCN